MTPFAIAIANKLGVLPSSAKAYLESASAVVEGEEFLAVRRGNQVHLAVKLGGLGGRKVLRKCREILEQWQVVEPLLFAPVRHGNEAAIRIAEALGFVRYASDAKFVWLLKRKD